MIMQRKVSLIDALFLLLVIFILMLLVYLISNVTIYWYLSLLGFGIITLYITRYDAVIISLYENSVLINFFLIKKKIEINYDEIIKLKSYSNTYEGVVFRIIIKHKNKKYSIRTKFYDEEFVDFLKAKTGLEINK